MRSRIASQRTHEYTVKIVCIKIGFNDDCGTRFPVIAGNDDDDDIVSTYLHNFCQSGSFMTASTNCIPSESQSFDLIDFISRSRAARNSGESVSYTHTSLRL